MNREENLRISCFTSYTSFVEWSVQGRHPQCNRKAERFNKTLLVMLRTLPEEQKNRWHEYILKVVHAYNCTKIEPTRYSPFFLLFRRSPRFPIDMILGTSLESVKGAHSNNVTKWKSVMSEAYTLAA